MIYEIGADGMKPLTTDGKNDLPTGTVLHLNGYDCPDYVIVENQGVRDSRFTNHGTRYQTVNLSTFGFQLRDAIDLKFQAEQKDGRIQIYITDRHLTPEETAEALTKAKAKEKADQEARDKAEAKRAETETRGRKLFSKYIPADAKALIIAQCNEDDTDLMTDYHGSHTTGLVVLGWSTHTRNLFPEMRKHADRIPETAHLTGASDEAEHRENYSMGHGNYLKEGYYNRSGWLICKAKKYRDDWSNEFYESVGRRCIFE